MIKLIDILNEVIEDDRIDCDKCDHSWPIVTGGNDLYICHECGHDNTPH
jgi:DNA-directed RNA polymerase subunit RPC12/RpoP